MSEVSLFRSQAIEHRDSQHLGSIVLLRPLSLKLLTLGAVGTAVLLIAFLCFGQYTRKTYLSGVLLPQQGLIEIQPHVQGLILETRVSEGSRIRKGDVLFVVSAERINSSGGSTQAEISRQVRMRRETLARELSEQRKLQQKTGEAIIARIASLTEEHRQLEAQIATEEQRAASLTQTVAQFEKLRGDGYVSAIQLQEKRDAALERSAALHELERARTAMSRQLSDARSELANLPLRSGSALAPIEQDIARAEQELSQSEAQRAIVVTATHDGVVATLTARVGESVMPETTLATLVPAGSLLEAHLYAPSRAMGFIQPGQAVLLHFQAFPYQRFGQHTGVVGSVSTAPDAKRSSNEPTYRITVTLPAQFVKAYGREQPLRAGMQLDAAVLLERRPIIEWVLEPLYSVTGRT